MKKSLIVLSIVLCFAALGTAQTNYKSAIGARLGYPLSASYKMFIKDNHAIEALGGFGFGIGYSVLSANLAYQIHNDLSDVTEGFSWYYGAGAGVNLYTYRNTATSGGVGVTLNGYVGVEYVFADHPVSISADIVPTLPITGGYAFYPAGGLAVRYILGR